MDWLFFKSFCKICPNNGDQDMKKKYEITSNGNSDELRACCQDLTAKCLACTKDINVDKYCWNNSSITDCTNPLIYEIKGKFTDVENVNYRTYRILYKLNQNQKNLYTIFGTIDYPLVFPAAYQVAQPIDEDTDDGNTKIAPAFPNDDNNSWIGIGIIDGVGNSDNDAINIDFSQWSSKYSLNSKEGQIYLDAQYDEMPPDGPVVIAQITIPDEQLDRIVKFNAKGKSNDGSEWIQNNLKITL